MAEPIQLPGYQLEKKFAEGGMAAIYLGKQTSLGRPVAVKVMKALPEHDEIAQEDIREAFESEAVIISRLNHPNIVQVIDRGMCADGTPYFVMEYIKGVSLAKAISLNTLSMEQRYKLALQICQAIDYAHKNKVIHRDIKPENVLVDMQGNAKVLDFGIAVLEHKKPANNREAQVIAGTARYMAPEVMSGERAASISSDIFSLGFVLHELFSGLSASSAAVVQYRPLHEINPQLPTALDDIVQKCLSSKPDMRPPSVQKIIQQLLELSHGQHLALEQRTRAQNSVGKRAFQLLDVLSETENSSVYLFEEKNHHAQVLVKKFPEHVPGFIENKRLMALPHKHIVPVLGASKNERVFVIVTPYMPGGTLQDRLVRHFSLEEFMHLARQICSAMAFAHQNGIYHGSLSPRSIVFDESGAIQISDFALKPELDRDAPEFLDKKRYYSADIDLRSAGLLFYHLLTGEEAAFKGGNLKITAPFKQVPEKLQEIIKGMLGITYKPFTSFAEVQSALDTVTDALPTMYFQQNREEKNISWKKKISWIIGGAIVLGLCAAAASKYI